MFCSDVKASAALRRCRATPRLHQVALSFRLSGEQKAHRVRKSLEEEELPVS